MEENYVNQDVFERSPIASLTPDKTPCIGFAHYMGQYSSNFNHDNLDELWAEHDKI